MQLNFRLLALLMGLSLSCYSQSKLNYIHAADSIAKGFELHDNEEFAEAIKLYSYVSPGDTNYELAVYEKCLSLVSNEQYEEAATLALEGVEFKNSSEGQFYNLLGTAYDNLDQKEKAIDIYAKAIERFPFDHNLYYNRAVVYYDMEGQIANAYLDLKKAVEINPYHPSSHLMLAKIALNEEQYAQALLAIGFFLTLEPTTTRANAYLSTFNDAVSDKVEQESKNLTLEFQDDFKKINLLITSYASLRDDYRIPGKMKLPLNRQLHLTIDQAIKMKKRRGFWQNFYLPFYDEIMNNDYFEPFNYRLVSSSGSSKHQSLIKKKSKQIKAFVEYIGPKVKDIYSFHYIDYDETLDQVNFWFNERGNSVEAVGKKNNEGSPVGDYIFYYESGAVASRGVFKDGKRDGLWTFYYASGIVSGTQTYKEGASEGPDTDFYENGRTYITSSYEGGKRNGKTSVYNETGDLARSMYHKDGEINDSLVYYYPSGDVDYMLPMNIGIINGKATYNRPDGTIGSFYTWADDNRSGPFERYFTDGTTSVKGTYKEGELDGPYVSYYSNGNVREKGNYLNGIQTGKWEEFFYDGKMQETSTYDEKGKTTGIRETYDYNGLKKSTYEFLKGEMTSYIHYDREGNIIHQDKRKKGEFWFEYYTIDGVKTSEGTYVGDHREGLWKYYTKNGVLKSEESCNKKGETEGEAMTYYINGKVKSRKVYKEDEQDGYEVNFHDNGQMAEQGYYWNDKAYGTWKSYHEDGALSSVLFYVDNKYNGPQYWYNVAGELYLIEHFDMGVLVKTESCHADSTVYKSSERAMPVGFNARFYPNGQEVYKLEVAGKDLFGSAKWYYGTGQLSSEGQYLEGDRNGEWQWYFPNGKPSTIGTYSFGKRTGAWKAYYKNGQLSSLGTYENGNIHGEELSYHEDGKLAGKVNYFQGEINGKRYFYNYNGEIDHIRIYDQGRIIGYSHLGKDSKEVAVIPVNKETAEIVSYYPSGQISRTYQIKNGQFQGEYLEYNKDGSLRYQSTYIDDNREGIVKYFDKKGKLKREVNYVNGLLNGSYTKYYSNGKVKMKCNYVNDELHGIKEEYDANGTLTNKYEYKGGLLYEKL